MTGFRTNVSGVSDKGLVRSANEDSILLRGDVGLWVVADGMGGHAHGKWASEQLVASLSHAPLTGNFDASVRAVGEAVREANLRICAAVEQAGTQIGSTVAVLLLHGSRFAVFWAGDSRVYLCRAGQLVQLTTDHTYVQDLVAAGSLTPQEAKHHPSAHVLSRAVGVTADLELDAIADEAQPLDVFLLCSDGLTGLVSDSEIAERLSQFPPAQATRRLIELTLSRGATDNVSVITIRCEEATNVALADANRTGGVGPGNV